MKILTLAKNYHKKCEEVSDYLHAKLNLEEVVSESFAVVVMDVFDADTPKLLRIIVDIVDFIEGELVAKCWIEVDANEVDRFMAKDPTLRLEILSVNALNKFEPPPILDAASVEGEEEECPDCEREEQEYHVRQGH